MHLTTSDRAFKTHICTDRIEPIPRAHPISERSRAPKTSHLSPCYTRGNRGLDSFSHQNAISYISQRTRRVKITGASVSGEMHNRLLRGSQADRSDRGGEPS